MNLNPRTLALAAVALVIAGVTAFLIQGWMDSQRAALNAKMPKPSVGTEVLVAKKNMPAGTLIKPAYLEWRQWPESGVVSTYAVKGKAKIEDFTGAVVRTGIIAGEPIAVGRFVKPGERGFMAAVITPGMRAVTVPVNATSGIAGFVFPGDRVDLVLTHRAVTGEGGARQKAGASETVLENMRVLAVDQSTNDQKEKASVSKTVTLEVTPKQVEMISVADQLGQLSLSLRSLPPDDGNDDEPAKPEPEHGFRGRSVTRDDEVSRLIGAETNTHEVSIVHGNKTEVTRVKRVK
jgi:pilus assembly protein CpaB